jgi:ADP-heptose:LPS heptosyltransferase
MLRFEDIRFDCELYNGYKPCRYGNECAGCPYYTPREPRVANPGEPVAVPPPVVTRTTDEPTQILIIKTGAMGDVLRTTTLLPAIKRAHPQSHITWVTDAVSVPLLQWNQFIDHLLAFDADSCAELEARDFDLLMNFEKEKEPLALAGRVRAAGKAGFAPTHWTTATVFNAESRYALLLGLSDELKFRVNQKAYPQIIAEMAGLPYQRDAYVLGLGVESLRRRTEIEAILGQTMRPRIGLNTGCGSVFRTKQWTLEGWVELAGFIQAHAQADVLLLGGSAEEELNRQIHERCPWTVHTGCGNSLEEFFGVVQACDMVVTSDSLAMHIAIALQKYVIALFGSTSHQEVDLYDRGEKIVTDFACSPCYLKTCDKTPTCMQAMSGSMVGAAVLRGLSALRSGRTAASTLST